MQALNALAVLSDSGAAIDSTSSNSSHDDVHCSSGATCPIDYATSDTSLDTVVRHSKTHNHTTTPSKCAHHHHA
jgi:hypothetical protein